MTRAEFEAGYASRSGMTADELRELGIRAVPCDCGSSMCKGWAMEFFPCERAARQLRARAGTG